MTDEGAPPPVAASAPVSARRPRTALDLVLAVVNGVLTVLYPVAIWLGLARLGARGVGLVALALLVPMLAIRLRKADRATFWAILRLPLMILSLVTLGIVTDDPRFLLAMPVLISTALLVAFGGSLRRGSTPMIERFARTVEPDLTPAKQAHCREWTWIWCGFFVVNGAVAAGLGAFASHFLWAAYTGGIAYALMGTLFAGEWIHRRLRFGARPAL